jgi:PAS domain S-box-containing protein
MKKKGTEQKEKSSPEEQVQKKQEDFPKAVTSALAEGQLRLVIESAKDYAIFTLGTDRKVISWSSGAQLIVGYTEAEIIGQSSDVIFVPEDREAKAPEQEVQTAAEKGRAENERWHLRKDGSRFWGSGVTHPLHGERRRLVGFVKIMRDLTEAKRLEEVRFFLASIVDTTNDSIITIDFQRNITTWNKAAQYLYGYTAEEAIGKNLTMLTLPEDFAGILAKVDAVQHSREVVVFDAVRHKKDGQFIDLEIVMSPVLNAGGEVIGISTIARDISERKRREANLSFLAEINLGFAPLLSIQEVMEPAANQLAAYLQLHRCHFSLIDEEADRVEVLYEYRRDESLPSIRSVQQISDKLTEEDRRYLSAGKLVVMNAVPNNSTVNGGAARLKRPGFGSAVYVPHLEGGRCRFLLTAGRAEASEWRKDELELLQELASKIYIRIERAKAEEALKKSEERMRLLSNAVPQVIWTNTADGRANYFNQRWYEFTGLSYEQSEGPGWQAIVHGDDAQVSIQKWKEALTAGKVFETEYRLRRHDGIYCWFIGRNVPLRDEGGKITGWFGSATEIENLKKTEEAFSRSEARLRITMESATDYAIITMDPGRRVEKWSQGATQLLGYSEVEMIGQSADIIFTEEDLEAGAQENEMETARDTGRAPDERWHRRKDGSRFYASGVLRPIQDSELTGYVKVLRDMTQQQLFTEELHRLVAERTLELQRSNEELRQFATIASHDLQEPLRKLKLFTSVLQKFKNELPEEGKELLRKIHITSDRMSQLIREVLLFSKIAYGVSEYMPTDLNQILQNVLGDLDMLVSETGTTIIYDGNLPRIEAASSQINQLFYNLLTNAVKFRSEDRRPVIQISVRPVSKEEVKSYPHLRQEKEYIEIVFSDNGIGFEQQYAEQIFQIFERLHSADEFEGTGVGLSLCKKIVENHLGHIYALSSKGNGTAFHLLLPVRQ